MPSTDRAERIAQSRAPSGGPAELDGELSQHVFGAEIAARSRDLMPQDLGVGEVLKEGDEIGERLVKGQDVAISRLEKVALHTVEDCVRGLVGDDVVRQARERHAARHAIGGRLGTRREVAEKQRLLVPVIIGVLLAERVRVDAQALRRTKNAELPPLAP